MGEYTLGSGAPLANAGVAVGMLRRGRLHLLPPGRSRGFRAWIRLIGKSS